jgi:hypothetical protein
MSYAFAVSPSQTYPASVGNIFVASASVAVTSGTYPVGGIGPIGLAALFNLGVSSKIPTFSSQESVGDPPSGIVYQYDKATDKLRAMVTGAAAGSALQEFSGTIPADTIYVTQFFSKL